MRDLLPQRVRRKCRQVIATAADKRRQPEIVIWPPKPEILVSLELWRRGKSGNDNVAAKTGNIYVWNHGIYDRNSKGKSGVFDHADVAELVETPRAIAATTDDRKCQYKRFGHQSCHLCLSVVVAVTWLHLSNSSWSKMPDLPLEFRRYLLCRSCRDMCFRF